MISLRRLTSFGPTTRAPFIALAITLGFAWVNFATTARWATAEGALHGWRRPWYGAALAVATVLAFAHRRRVGQAIQPGALAPRLLLAASVAIVVGCLFSRLPVSTWAQVPFDDDWTPLFQAAVNGVRLLERGIVMGWNWSFLGGYPASTDVAQSFAALAFVPMQLFGERIGFHVVHAVWFLSVPLFVWWDLRHEDRHLALVATAFACLLTAGFSVTLEKSGDVNSLAGVFSAGLAMVGSRLARLGRWWGGPLLLVGLTSSSGTLTSRSLSTPASIWRSRPSIFVIVARRSA